MRLNVNSTRMELMRLKKRLIVAQRGHKLLKDKQDELMRRFMEIIEETRAIRVKVEEDLSHILKRFIHINSYMGPERVYEALVFPSVKIDLSVKVISIMNVKVPEIALKKEESVRCYGYAGTSGELDLYLVDLGRIFGDMIRLAQNEKRAELLADDLVKTRRRVNALEYVLIPNIKETTRYITLKLDEMERSNLSRLMKVKDIVRAK
jgi:V/A-type H+/Na+-transporting ATPase subunit D